MNHSTKPTASTARWDGRGRAASHCSMRCTHLVSQVSAATGSAAALTARSVTVCLCKSTPTNVANATAGKDASDMRTSV